MTTLSIWQCACVQCGAGYHIMTPAKASRRVPIPPRRTVPLKLALMSLRDSVR